MDTLLLAMLLYGRLCRGVLLSSIDVLVLGNGGNWDGGKGKVWMGLVGVAGVLHLPLSFCLDELPSQPTMLE